jgi:hypothetical protein
MFAVTTMESDPADEIEKIKDEYKLRRTLKAIEAIDIGPSFKVPPEFYHEASLGSLYITDTGLFVCYGKIDGKPLWKKVDDRLPNN